MKSLKILFLLCLAVFIANAQNYKSLDKPLQDEKNSFIEAFSFACGACYNHHKFGTLAKVKEKLPLLSYKIYTYKNIIYGEEFASLYAYADAQDRAKGLDGSAQNSLQHKLADAYFVAIFERKQSWQNSQSFYELGLKTLNISQGELDKFLVSTQGKRIYNEYDKALFITSQYGGTPAFLVNGKYFIIMKNIHGLDEMVEVIKDASKK